MILILPGSFQTAIGVKPARQKNIGEKRLMTRLAVASFVTLISGYVNAT
jgi:hypothetical protein